MLAPDTVHQHLFADEHAKLYPCHTAPATWMSTLFYLDKQAEFDQATQARINKGLEYHAEFFGIKGETDKLRAKFAASQADPEARLPDEDFAIVWEGEGLKERHWPLRNALEVKFAAMAFSNHRDQFRFADRHRIATRILEKAAAYGAGLSEYDQLLEKTAANGGCAARTAAEMLEERAKMTRLTHTELSAELVKLAAIIRNSPAQARGREQLIKIATIVDDFDRETHLNRMYDAGGLGRPEEILFQVTEKVANQFQEEHVPLLTGNIYTKDDLEKLSATHVRQWMGDEFVNAVTAGGLLVDGEKLAAIAPTLDRGMAQAFERCIRSAGILPAVREKAAATEGPLSRKNLFALATSYQAPSQPVDIHRPASVLG